MAVLSLFNRAHHAPLQHIQNRAEGFVANLVVETAGAHGFAEDGVHAVGHVANLAEAGKGDLDGFRVVCISSIAFP